VDEQPVAQGHAAQAQLVFLFSQGSSRGVREELGREIEVAYVDALVGAVDER
jgi:hypothetical protein